MRLKLSRLFSISLLLAGLLTLPVAALAQGGTTYFVFNVNATNFPDVQFDLRAVDLNNVPVQGLNNSNTAVYENGQPVTNAVITPRVDGPVNYIFVIDQGRLANYTLFGLNNIRLAVTNLISGGYFKDGVDTVTILARQNINSDQTITWLPTTSTGADLTTFMANFNFARGNGATKGLLGVEDAITTQVPNIVSSQGSETTAIIFITRYLEDPPNSVAVTAAQNTAALAKTNNISVYVFQTDFGKFNNQPLQALATGATGVYVPLRGSTVVTDTSNVYQAINSQRATYTVSYRSTSADAGQRQITINAAQPTGIGTVGIYEANVQAPKIAITEPTPNTTVRREPQPSSDGTNVVYDVNSQHITTNITWLDTPRLIKSVELFADGVSQEVQTPTDPAQTTFEFDWDLSDIDKVGTTPVKISVTVTDELGLSDTAETTVNVEVIALPPTPTPSPTPFTIGIEGDTGKILADYWVVIPVLCLGLLCMLPFAFLIFYMTRPVQARKVVKDIQHTLIGGAPLKSKSLASVTVVEGPKGLIGENISITKAITTLGRNPKMADVVFYADEESSVSRLHCTIQLDGKTFKLTDNNSTSGTRLNGRRLSPNDPVELQDGDEIVLGDLGKLGVKLRFGFLMDKTQLPSSGTASDKTFIMDDYDKDDWDKYKDH
jgi:hypothetical protein